MTMRYTFRAHSRKAANLAGSLERMLAVLIEHYGGKWPLWLSPRQVIRAFCLQNAILNDFIIIIV